MTWAQQCFRLAVSLDPAHSEAWNNLAVLEMRRGNDEQVWLLIGAAEDAAHVGEAN